MAVFRGRLRAVLLTVTTLLLARSSRAQSRPGTVAAPDSLHQQLQISTVLPKSVSVIRDCARVLFSRQDSQEKVEGLLARRRQKTEKPVVGITLTLPRNKLTKALRLAD